VELVDGYIATQYGFLNRTQGIAFYGERGFKRRVRDGDLVRELSGLYRMAGVALAPEHKLYLATFAYNGVASHKGAGGLRDFERCAGLPLEVSVKEGVGSRKRRVGFEVTIHRTNFLPETHLDIVRGIACTSAARTICDLSLHFSALSLGKIVDDAKRRKLVTYEAVAECRDELRTRGRRRTTVVDEVLRERGIDFDPGDSRPELRTRRWLEEAGLRPVTQHPIILGGIRRSLDLAFPPERVAVEYLGLDGHGLPLRVLDDALRTTQLQLAGWLVVFVTKDHEARSHRDGPRGASPTRPQLLNELMRILGRTPSHNPQKVRKAELDSSNTGREKGGPVGPPTRVVR
jgi:hypothetical protein